MKDDSSTADSMDEISQYDIEDCEHDQEPGTTENNDETTLTRKQCLLTMMWRITVRRTTWTDWAPTATPHHP